MIENTIYYPVAAPVTFLRRLTRRPMGV